MKRKNPMIIIAGTIDLDPEQREAALEAGKPHAAATRAQKGCIDYVWSADNLVPGRVYVFERWEDEESLRKHFEGEHYLNMRKTIGSFGKLSTDIWKYRPEIKERVYDETGTPRADFFTEG
jgi:quinol monooxygenase YgiN